MKVNDSGLKKHYAYTRLYLHVYKVTWKTLTLEYETIHPRKTQSQDKSPTIG